MAADWSVQMIHAVNEEVTNNIGGYTTGDHPSVKQYIYYDYPTTAKIGENEEVAAQFKYNIGTIPYQINNGLDEMSAGGDYFWGTELPPTTALTNVSITYHWQWRELSGGFGMITLKTIW